MDRTRMGIKAAAFVAAVLFAQQMHAAGEVISPNERPWGTYSSLCVHEETGDILGIEVSFVYFPTNETSVVLYQHAEGELPSPRLLTVKKQNDGSMKLQSESADMTTITLEATSDNKLIVKLKRKSPPETTWEEILSKRAPAWGEGRKLPVCTARGR